MMKIIKSIITLTFLCFCCLFSFNYITISADPMDALNDYSANEDVIVTTDPNSMPRPTVGDDGNEDEENSEEKLDSNLSAKDIKQENAISKGVTLMDSIMFFCGVLCCLIPVFLLGFYGMASVNPPVFDPLFHLATMRKLHYTDITAKQIILKSLPIIVFGLMLSGGAFKALLGRVWYHVGELIY